MILASCCGPLDDISPDDLKAWAIIALVCGVLLLGDAAALAWLRWREGERILRQRAVLVALVAALGAFVVAQRAWTAYLVTPTIPITNDMYQSGTLPVAQARSVAALFGTATVLVTLLLLMLCLVDVACHFSRR